MSRKRRRSCKGRKSSDTRENEHLPILCRCQQNTETTENRASEDMTNIHELVDLEQSEKNRNHHSCTVENEKKNRSDNPENKEQENMSDSEKEGKYEKDCSSLPFSTHQNEISAVLSIDGAGISSTKNVTLQCDTDVEGCHHTENGFTADVTCGSFGVKVEVKKDSLFVHGTDCAAGKKECSRNRWCHKRCCCKGHKKSRLSAGHSGQDEAPSKCTIKIGSNQNPSLKLSVVGKEIKVKCVDGNQKLMISIVSGNKPRKCGKARTPKFASDADYSETEASCHSDLESDFCFQEKEVSFTNYACPEWYALIPPPAAFADPEEIYLDSTTEIVSLSPAEDISDTFSAALNCGGDDFSQEKDPKRMEHDSGNNFYKDIVFSEFSYTGDSVQEDYSSRETHFCQRSNEEKHDMLQGRNSSLIDTRDIMLISDKESKNTRRNSFPATSIDILSSFHPRRDSGFYSMPSLSLKVLPKPNKTTNIYIKSAHAPNSYTELCSSFTSMFDHHRDLKLPCFYAFSSYDHDMNVYHAELEEDLDSAFFIDHSVEYEEYREMGYTIVDDFQYNREKIENSRAIESPRILETFQEYTEFSKSEVGCEVLKSNQHIIQSYLELQNEAQLSQILSGSGSPSSDYTDNSSISAKTAIECLQDSAEQPNTSPQLNTAESEITKKKRRGSVMTVIIGELEQRLIIQGDSRNMADSFGSAMKKDPILPCGLRDKPAMSPLLDAEEPDVENEFQSFTDFSEMFESLHEDSDCHAAYDLATAASVVTSENEPVLPEHFFTDVKEMSSNKQDMSQFDHPVTSLAAGDLQELSKPNCETPETQSEIERNLDQNVDASVFTSHETGTASEAKNTNLFSEPTSTEERTTGNSQEEATDRWARRRKQYKDSKRGSSVGGSSIASTITEGSITSEDGRSFDVGLSSENEERGFYTEIFHSTSWVFRGDDASPNNSPRCLSKRPRPVAVRERTVKIVKGTGGYPWGFRIQFSKPILVTEVDTNSAAEEAGLQIGDIVMAVNGTDVTSMPHSEAANLARKGPDVLTLLVGSDISRCPNNPRPTCRGYLHKRAQSGILKGWRKRWFVLKHDGCLYYYKHRKDEGKCRPLEVTKLEGAEIGVDTSLGKPFVFKCIPQTGSRIFCFCATSNQEMKRWLEAMEKAVHPVHQNHVWVDVTIHNTSLPPLAIKNPECLGLLHQLDKNKETWIQHYCILKDGCLYFYASIRSTHALGGIYLQGYTVSEQALGSRRSVIEAKPPSEEFKTFYLCAESVNENKRWITALKTSISKWMPLNKAIQDFMNRPLEETKM